MPNKKIKKHLKENGNFALGISQLKYIRDITKIVEKVIKEKDCYVIEIDNETQFNKLLEFIQKKNYKELISAIEVNLR